jgi:hypothetical protein
MMEINEALVNAPLVTISNFELFEICWYLDLNLSKPNDAIIEKDGLEKVRTTLIEKGALLIKCRQVHDLKSVGSYKILSESHGFFKETAYEGQAFIQICLDVLDVNNTEYGLLAIANYDSSEVSQLWLKKYHAQKTTS